jgi:hypothetical protein
MRQRIIGLRRLGVCEPVAARGPEDATAGRADARKATSHVQARPPIRAVASSTIAERPLVASRRAAAIPAAPAPTTTTSALALIACKAGCGSEGL